MKNLLKMIFNSCIEAVLMTIYCELLVHELYIEYIYPCINGKMIFALRVILFFLLILFIVIEEKKGFINSSVKYVDSVLWIPFFAVLITCFPKFSYDRQLEVGPGVGLIILLVIMLYPFIIFCTRKIADMLFN